MRRLVVVRHAEAGPAAPGVDDHERALTEAGRSAALHAGRRLGAEGAVDLALVSTARRAVQTLEGMVAGGLVVGATRPVPQLYDARAGELLDLVHEVPDDVHTLLLVGHAPGLPGLVDLLLADGSGSDADRSALARGMAPASCVLLGVDRPWADLDPRQGDLLAVHA